ncbi:MAG: hypothetical protein JOZ17_01570 [Acetobacteraceae bacterium]|nr:hypothetical protein [Acetobacteraceae bacterium]
MEKHHLYVSGAVPVARLTEVFHQAAESRIINVHRINQSQMPKTKPDRGQPALLPVARGA